MLRPTNIVYADGTSLTNIYYPTGQLQSNYGSRAYPVAYTYDPQGRMLSMTNWSVYPTGGARATTWNYDDYRGFLTSKTDAGNNIVTYSSTPAGRLRLRTWARNINTTYGYNPAHCHPVRTHGTSTGYEYHRSHFEVPFL